MCLSLNIDYTLRIVSNYRFALRTLRLGFLQHLARTKMSYEPGSIQCRGLIAAKESLLSAINSLSKIENTIHITDQLKKLYRELDEMHEGRKILENEF